MYPTESLEACDCLDWFIYILEYVSWRRLWYGLLLAFKEMT